MSHPPGGLPPAGIGDLGDQSPVDVHELDQAAVVEELVPEQQSTIVSAGWP
ncbi:hypothetical protein [Streptomyces platensis]|uniref:hypothetical protein n=1 Tax=Streptomyces platensis TaxID=58346 RepID=UPI00142EF5DE|nr:hypothetical protein [Streptomyces platensis]